MPHNEELRSLYFPTLITKLHMHLNGKKTIVLKDHLLDKNSNNRVNTQMYTFRGAPLVLASAAQATYQRFFTHKGNISLNLKSEY